MTKRSVELFENPDYGTTSDGGSALGSNLYGVWKSEDLGEYEAFVTTKVKACVLITDDNKTIAFNHSNVDTTRQIYEQLEDYRKSAASGK